MGNWNSGPRPDPTKLKVLKGNTRRSSINAHESHPPPAPDAFETPPPTIVDDPVALAEWQRLGPLLRNCGLASEAERASLVALCQQWSQYVDAHAKVRQLGMLVKTQDDRPMANPYVLLA